MAVMFPVPASVGLQFLVEHIETALRAWSPFSIHLKGFSKSHDHWLFLTVDKGRGADVPRLHHRGRFDHGTEQ